VFGKPGRIIAEGEPENVSAFLLSIKRMKWQRVLLVSDKMYDTASGNARKFEGFFEVESDKVLREMMEQRGLKEEFGKFFTEI